MLELYLTPSSISYLTQLLLTLIITGYLVRRSIRRGKRAFLWQDGYLLTVFISLTLLSLFFFLDYSMLPSDRLAVAYFEPPVIAILLIALIQFAYEFPASNGKNKIERWIVFSFCSFYFYWELEFAIQRFFLLNDGAVIFRSSAMGQLMVAEFAWAVFVFVRNSIQNWKLPAARNFALILLMPMGLAVLEFFRGINPLATFWFPSLSAIGLLFTIFFFTLNYLSSKPEQVSFVVKISGAMLTSVLAVFSIISWLITPIYTDRFIAPIQNLDHRSLRFNPDGKGGYLVTEIPFHWEPDLGEQAEFPDFTSVPSYSFKFPFLGQSCNEIFITADGLIGVGSLLSVNAYQYRFTAAPAIIPLLVKLDTEKPHGGGIFVRQSAEKMLVTWYRMPSFYRGDLYTFQTTLFSDGSFEFTYNSLPQIKFHADDFPDASVWAIGIKPIHAPLGTADFTRLPMQIGSQGAIQDEYRSFRIYLHQFILPLARAVIVSSFAFLLGAALMLNYGLARPLNALLQGVQNFNRGQRDTAIPIQSNDEIGFLTESFNKVGGELNSLIHGLEQRVAERTQELANVNTQLRSEMEARASAQAQVMEQQRAVTTLEERERLARDLHDGIGQVLGFLNVQAQSANDFVQAGDQETASHLLGRMVEVAQEAHNDVRGYILGLKKETSQPRQNYFTQLEQYRQHLLQSFGFQTRLNLPGELPSLLAVHAVETQLLYVTREALSNARTHSGQNQAEVTLTFDATHVQVRIEDHGVGFSTQGREGHFGLGIMRERAEAAGGSLEIETGLGAGTRVTVRLPRQLGAESTLGRRVLLVDDHPLFLEGMANLITGRGMQVVGTASDGLEAQQKARTLSPDVILMDIEMPRCDGLEATRRIKADLPNVKIVMLTTSGEERHLFQALQSGASGYLLKSLDAAELTCLLEELLRGEVSLSPSLANKMLEAFTRHKSPPAQLPGIHPEKERNTNPDLTERQFEILRLVGQGLAYKQIAFQLGLAEVTIKYHMGEILARLHLASRSEAVQYVQGGKLK